MRNAIKMNARTRLGASLLLAGSVLGCSTTYREMQAYQDGWRTAKILEVSSAAGVRHKGATDCRESATSQELAARQFAAVTYRATGRWHVHIVMLQENTQARPGDRVFTNVLRCGTPVEVLS